MQDIENNNLFDLLNSFAHHMHEMRDSLAKADTLYYKYQKERLFLDAVNLYCEAINSLTSNLSRIDLKSRGFLAFCNYLTCYLQSPSFTSLFAATKKNLADLSAIKYGVFIKNNSITVCHYKDEIDYSMEVEQTFAKFKQEAVNDYRMAFYTKSNMNHVEAQILDGVVQLYPDVFKHLDDFCTRNSNYVDETISIFDREIQFYIAYLEYILLLKRAGLKFCYPQMSTTKKEVYNDEGFDLALAYKLMNEKMPVISNDFYLKGKERTLVVTGPNQGGKTTFARTFGQLHYLASIGCPIPGREAQFFLFDKLFTHFEKEENIKNLRGKLEDDLVRVHHILNEATPNSIIIMNEILTSTTLQDAIFLSKKLMEHIIQLDLLCVWVTFIDELASLSEKTVSMLSTVVPENPAVRTFKIVRKPTEGFAYALSIAEKYRLTYDDLKERIKS